MLSTLIGLAIVVVLIIFLVFWVWEVIKNIIYAPMYIFNTVSKQIFGTSLGDDVGGVIGDVGNTAGDIGSSLGI